MPCQDLGQLFDHANFELEKSTVWFKANKLTLNVKKTKFMMFTDKNLDIGTNTLKIGNQIIEQIGSNCKDKYFKFVGHVLDDKLGWDGHIEHISKKLAGANFAINCSKNFLPLQDRKTLYYSLFDSHLNFGNLLWGCAKAKNLKKIESLQKRCIRNVSLKSYKSHSEPLFKDLDILKFSDKLSQSRAIFMHKYRHKKLPTSFSGIFIDTTTTDSIQSRHNDYNYQNFPAIRKNLENFPLKQIIFNWNFLSLDLKATADPIEFGNLLKRNYLSQYSYETDCFEDCFNCKTT